MQLKTVFVRAKLNVNVILPRRIAHISPQQWSFSSVLAASDNHSTSIPEVPELFDRLLTDKVLKYSFEENSSNLSKALDTIQNYKQYGDKSTITNSFSENKEYLNEIISYLINNSYSDDVFEFITFCDELHLLHFITSENMENIIDTLLNSGRIHETIEIALKYKSLTPSMHETIGMAICSTPWTDTFHHSLYPLIIQWMRILTKQYIQYFHSNQDKDTLDNVKNEDIPLIRPKFEAFFIYITHLLARDGVDYVCKEILRTIEPIISNVKLCGLRFFLRR